MNVDDKKNLSVWPQRYRLSEKIKEE